MGFVKKHEMLHGYENMKMHFLRLMIHEDDKLAKIPQ